MVVEPLNSQLQVSCLASGLINMQQLDYCLRIARHRLSEQGIGAENGIPDRFLADIFVEQELITAYQSDQLLTGRTKFSLGSYVITDWIGQGGMGQVFKAVHHVMGRICAVKVLPLARATDQSRRNFVQEIRMQAALDCPYLVRAYDAGQDGNVHYLVTEYVPGMDLRRLVKNSGPRPVAQAAKILMQAALGLDYAHGKGLVHRDVKPGNILVTPDGATKVSDVGLAGFANDLSSDPRAGKIVGTTDYLSPEQIRTPLEISAASDIYSLGCTLYYALCGKVPFPGGDTKSKLHRHLQEHPMHPRRFVPDPPEDFVDIIADMMEKDPEKRIASAAQVAARLEPWASDEHELGVYGLTRSPWLAPPPPSHDESLESISAGEQHVSDRDVVGSTDVGIAEPTQDARLFQQAPPLPHSAYDGQFSVNQSARAIDIQASTTLPPQLSPSSNHPSTSLHGGSRVAMIVALTLAIAIPPALLLGAILGFIVASK
ncbi:MAG TPA: serine/threonine protein kinase [Planctomycetaceae bacterium]|nr:serine/threonine protein kinase [Planctomycetaceae bacterium]